MRRAQLFQNRCESAARREDVVEQQNDAEHHHDRTAGVGERNRTEPADRGVDDNHDAEEHEPQLIGVARHCGEELRPAHELRDHRGSEKEHDHERRDCRERIRPIAVTDDVHDGDGVNPPCEPCNTRPEDPEHKEDGHGLDDRHVDPAEADLIRHAGTADEGTDRAVGCDHRHREHEAAERLPADEVG